MFPSNPRGVQANRAPRNPIPQERFAPRGELGAGMAQNHDFFGNNLPEQNHQPAFQVAPPSEEAVQTLMVSKLNPVSFGLNFN